MPKRKHNRDQDGLYRRKDSPYWWASFIDGGGRLARRSTGTTDKAEAKAIRAKWELEAHREREHGPRPSPKGHTFHELMVLFMQASERKSAERDEYSLKRLYPVFATRDLEALTAADVRGYIASRQEAGVSNGTINRELGLMSAALNWARSDLDWEVPNPVQGRKLREPEGRIRWITRAEAAALTNAAAREPTASHLVNFILLGLHTGMRRGEMLGLEWRRVDLQEGLIYLEGHHQKNGKIGSVPLNRAARESIVAQARFRAEHCPQTPWVFCDRKGDRIGAIKRSFATACKRAGIEDFHPHDLRHTCAAWLVQAGVSIREVAELLRHSDIRVTMRYAHLAPDNVRAAVEVLDGNVSRSGFTLHETTKKEGKRRTPTN